MDLPKHLKAWREKRKFTQREASEFLGVSLRTYEKWEQGDRFPRGLALTALQERTKPAKGKN
jgi:DNA-binding transcriptional regulator YiaG